VRGAAFVEQRVDGETPEIALTDLLEFLLRVESVRGLAHAGERLAQGRADERAHGLEAAVEVHGAENGLVDVGQDGSRQCAVAQTRAQRHQRIEPESERRFRERFARDDGGLALGHLAFVQLRSRRAEQLLGDHEVERRVAQELESLVVAIAADGTVREGQLEQRGVAEFVRDGRHGPGGFREGSGTGPAQYRRMESRSNSPSPAIEVAGLVKNFGQARAVDGLSLVVQRGESLGFLGPNGAGKTTTIRILSTLAAPTAGSVSVLGFDPARDAAKLRGRIGVVPQEIALYDGLTGAENLTFFGRMHGLGGSDLRRRVEGALDQAGLTERAQHRVATYSGGMKRRLNIVAALLHEPELVFLDEPTVGIDPQSRNHVFELVDRLRARGTTLVYTTHQLGEVERLCDRIVILDAGRTIAEGSLDELRQGIVAADSTRDRIVAGTRTAEALALLRAAGIDARVEEDLPDLEQVFLTLTGHALRDEEA